VSRKKRRRGANSCYLIRRLPPPQSEKVETKRGIPTPHLQRVSSDGKGRDFFGCKREGKGETPRWIFLRTIPRMNWEKEKEKPSFWKGGEEVGRRFASHLISPGVGSLSEKGESSFSVNEDLLFQKKNRVRYLRSLGGNAGHISEGGHLHLEEGRKKDGEECFHGARKRKRGSEIKWMIISLTKRYAPQVFRAGKGITEVERGGKLTSAKRGFLLF